MITPDDGELVAGCLRGDAVAWDSFVERFSKLVYWSIQKSLNVMPPGGREEFCREVFQDFFQRLMDKNELSKLKEASHVRKFLSVMACHMALDRFKALSRHAKNKRPMEDLPEEDEAQYPALPGDGPDDWEAICGVSLRELPAKERSCLEFYFLESKTAQEIGRLLGMSENSVHYVIRRSKDKIRATLVERGYET